MTTVPRAPGLSAHAKSWFYGYLEVVQLVRTGIDDADNTLLQQRDQAEPKFSDLIGCSSSDTQICVIGWRLNPNKSYTKVGEPCFVVYNK